MFANDECPIDGPTFLCYLLPLVYPPENGPYSFCAICLVHIVKPRRHNSSEAKRKTDDCPTGLVTAWGSESKRKLDEMSVLWVWHPVRYRTSIAKWLHVMLALLFGVGLCHRANPSPLIINQQVPLAGCVAGYNHHAIGGEVEWRRPLLYVYPLG